MINSISTLKKPMSHTQIKTKQNVSRKYMSLKEIDYAVANPNFGENITIDISYCTNPVSSLFQSSYPDLSTVSNTDSRYHSQVYTASYGDSRANITGCTVSPRADSRVSKGDCTYAGQSIYTGNRSYLDESLYLDYNNYNNYNLKPPVYAVPIPPVYRVQSQKETLESVFTRQTVPIPSLVIDSIDNNTEYKETHFLKLASRQTLKIGSNVLIKKTYNQYKICINHKATVKKIFKKNNGHWYFFVEIENEEIKKQIIEINTYLEKNNDKKFRYPFFKDINIVQEKSWIVIQNKTENFELIETNNEPIVALPISKPATSLVPTSTTSTSASTSASTSVAHFDTAHYNKVNADILASAAITTRLIAESNAFWDVYSTSVNKKQKI